MNNTETQSNFERILQRILVSIIFALAGGMFIIIFLQVIFRYVLRMPISWSEEIARYLMVWGSCLAAASAYGYGSHIGVKALVNLLSEKKAKWARIVVHLAVSTLMVVVTYEGFRLSFLLFDQESAAMQIPMTYPYLAIPVGAFLILVQAVVMIFHEFKTSSGNKPPG